MICGSMARSLGSKIRVGQLSMIAGAIAEPSISASDWVAKTTEAFFLRRVFLATHVVDPQISLSSKR